MLNTKYLFNILSNCLLMLLMEIFSRLVPSMLLLLLLLISCNTCSSLGFGSNNNNNITVGQSISGNQTLISRGGMFELGFFTLGNTPSDNYYLGIWYKNISIRTIVWLANRDNPVTYPFKLELSEDGFLVVSGKFRLPMSERYYNISSNARLAVLLDDGNLVLWSGSDSSSSSIVWQSFDHSTDTWLPGAKLASESRITSWRYADDPAGGEFSLQADTDGSLVLQNRDYTSNWTWHWNEDTSLDKYIKFNFVRNRIPMYNYVTYSVHNTSVPTRLVIGLLGRLQLLRWSESLMKWNLIIVQWDLCQENSWRQYRMRNCECLKGFQQWPVGRLRSRLAPYVCERKPTVCGYGDFEKDTFYVMTSIPLVENSFSIQDVKNVDECKRSCLKKCNCVAFVYTNSCLIWYGRLATLRQVSPNDDTGNYFYVRVAHSKKQKRSIATVVVIAVMGTTVILLCTVLSVIWKCRWRIFFNNNNAAAPVDSLQVSFRYRDLKNATKNFSQELGRGGFGSVFKGTMPDSTTIAVKKLECFAAGEKQFRSEVATIGVIHHVNLIRLRGFCAEGSKRLLVYDYMPNGSLNSYLFQTDSKVLDWKIRYQIILGIARGLEYLHDKCRDCIIHCDIKPENILLDVEFKPMVADFGLAKLLGRDFSRVLTTMRGTRGYLAPEWISGVPITTKADVYSYGMMVFEIISGRRNLDMVDEDMVDYFPARAASKANKGEEVISLLDKRLEGTADIDELTRACRVACWCIQDDENDRPSMGQIVGILEGHSEVGLPPVPSFLQVILHDPATTKHSILPSTVVGSDISFPSQDESINSCASSAV